MSEWNVGQTGGAGTRPGLTGALMLRFGADTAAPAETKAGNGAVRTQTESFSDILRDRTAQARDAKPLENQGRSVADIRKARNDSAAVTRQESRAAARQPAQHRQPAGTDPVKRADSADQTDRTVKPDPTATKMDRKDNVTTASNKEVMPEGTQEAQATADAQAMAEPRDVEAVADVGSDVEDEISPQTLAMMLNELLEAIQAAIAELSGDAEEGAGTETEAELVLTEVATVLSSTQGTKLSEDTLNMMQDVVDAGETASTEKAAQLPSPLAHALKNLLAKLNRQETTPVALTEKVAPGQEASLLAHLQHIAREIRELVQQTTSGSDTAVESLSGEEKTDLVRAVTPQTDTGGAGSNNSDEAAPQSQQHPQAFLAATMQQNAAGIGDGSAASQATGFQAAMAAGRIPEQQVPGTVQPNAPVLPQMPETPESARAVTNQVVTRLETMSGDERHEMELQLKPESLGKIQLRIVEERGMILARFTAESEKVRAILESNMQLLRDSLEKNGLTVQELSVSVGQQQPQSNNENAPQSNIRLGRTGIHIGTEGSGELADGSGKELRMSQRLREYLYGPDSTMSLKA